MMNSATYSPENAVTVTLTCLLSVLLHHNIEVFSLQSRLVGQF